MEMNLLPIDAIICVGFIVAVVIIGVLMARRGEKGETDSAGYFLAGRGLSWWLIGFSLIAANISAEQFVGMSGQAAKPSIGLAVASYEWIAAVTLVIVAFFFLPAFLKSGIFTIPEFLEYRYDHRARSIMSMLMVLVYVGVTLPSVIFLGAKALDPLFTGSVYGIPLNITTLSWVVGVSAAVYVAVGGLKACAWADLIQGSALIVGGLIIMVLALMALNQPENFQGIEPAAVADRLGVGGDATLAEKFAQLKGEHMHMVLPADNDFLPWTALLFGIWIPNLYYWGLNQYIMQRALGSKSLAEGQMGTVFAAALKLVIPFIVCVPGIIAFTLYAEEMHKKAMDDPAVNQSTLKEFEGARANPQASNVLFGFDSEFAALKPELASEIVAFNAAVIGQPAPNEQDLTVANDKLIEAATKANPKLEQSSLLVGYDYDSAFPILIRYLAPSGGLMGFILAALMGAVISSLAAMFNAASTIFTMDIYREYINRSASQTALVWVGRACVPVCVIIGCLIAPELGAPRFKGAFHFIQEFQGYISPGVLAIFLFGLFVPRTPRYAGMLGLVLNPIVYGLLHAAVAYGFLTISFPNRMALSFVVVALAVGLATLVHPLPEPVSLPSRTTIELHGSPRAKVLGVVVVVATAALYLLFW